MALDRRTIPVQDFAGAFVISTDADGVNATLCQSNGTTITSIQANANLDFATIVSIRLDGRDVYATTKAAEGGAEVEALVGQTEGLVDLTDQTLWVGNDQNTPTETRLQDVLARSLTGTGRSGISLPTIATEETVGNQIFSLTSDDGDNVAGLYQLTSHTDQGPVFIGSALTWELRASQQGDGPSSIDFQNKIENNEFWEGTIAQYDAIAVKDANLLYFITNDFVEGALIAGAGGGTSVVLNGDSLTVEALVHNLITPAQELAIAANTLKSNVTVDQVAGTISDGLMTVTRNPLVVGTNPGDALDGATLLPFGGYTLTGDPSVILSVPKWTSENNITWSVDASDPGESGRQKQIRAVTQLAFATDPEPEEVIFLTALDGANQIGIYQRNDGNTDWVFIQGGGSTIMIDEATGTITDGTSTLTVNPLEVGTDVGDALDGGTLLPLSGYTATGTPSLVNSTPRWTAENQITWTPPTTITNPDVVFERTGDTDSVRILNGQLLVTLSEHNAIIEDTTGLTSIALDDFAFDGTGGTATVTIVGIEATNFNISVEDTDPLGWLTAGALGATAGTIPVGGIFTTILTIPAVIVTVDRAASIRAINTADATDVFTTGLFRQMHTNGGADGDLVVDFSSVIIGTMATFSANITSGDPDFEISLFDVDPNVMTAAVPIQTLTESAAGTYSFTAIDTLSLDDGDHIYYLRVSDSNGDIVVASETITVIAMTGGSSIREFYGDPVEIYNEGGLQNHIIFEYDSGLTTTSFEIPSLSISIPLQFRSNEWAHGVARIQGGDPLLGAVTSTPVEWRLVDTSTSPSTLVDSGMIVRRTTLISTLAELRFNAPIFTTPYVPPMNGTGTVTMQVYAGAITDFATATVLASDTQEITAGNRTLISFTSGEFLSTVVSFAGDHTFRINGTIDLGDGPLTFPEYTYTFDLIGG